MSKSKADKMPLEDTLTAITDIVSRMEAGQQPLETALHDFEQGIRLIRQAQETLNQAEQRVTQLTQSHANDTPDNQ